MSSHSQASKPLTPPSSLELPLHICAGWGFGTLGVAMVQTASNIFILRYMTDIVGIGATTAALIVAVSKIYDAVTDPLMGWISDRTKSPLGRRRPYLMAGAILLALLLILLFSAPNYTSDNARIAYMAAALMLFATAYTVFNVPYLAMPAEMTDDYHQRSRLMSFRIYAVAASGVLASFVGPLLVSAFGGGVVGHRVMALILSPVVLASGLWAFWATRAAKFTERVSFPYTVKEQLDFIAGNKPFLLLLSIKFFTLMTLGAQAVLAFFFTRVLKVPDSILGIFFLTSALAMMGSQPLWLAIARRLGKRTTYMIALSLAMPVSLSWLLAGAGEPTALVLLRAALAGAAGGGVLLMGQSLLPDTIEYDYRRSGLRREGIFAGIYTAVEKLAAAAGVSIVGAFLGAMGYVQSRGADVAQPDSAITAMYICMALLPFSIQLLSFLLLIGYDLSEERLKNTTITNST